MTTKLFISYRSTDSMKVDAIVGRLKTIEKDGAPAYVPWQDKHDIPVGKDWWEAIVDAIIESQIFVFNISRSALESEVCRAELAYAYRRNRPIIPVVLEGEYVYNPATGKNKIDYWDKIPSELNDLRAQFLFYENDSFFSQFEEAIAEFQRNGQRDTPTARPLNPDARGDGKSSHDLYDEACEYAGHLAFDEAEKSFRRLMQRNDPDYGSVAYEWIEVLNLYKELIEVGEKTNARFVFKRKWKAYTALFPKEFLDHVFDPKDFASQFNSSGAVPAVPSIASLPTPVPTKPRVIDVLPGPFEWMNIPSGSVTLRKGGYVPEGGQAFDVDGFQMAKYPITNGQFARFVHGGGYDEKRWWTEAGWEQREANAWTQPSYWNDDMWNESEYPVVGVSWYEVVAFCQWLSETTADAVVLPTEQQWQRAAQGDSGFNYPWGDDWDGSLCNNSVDAFDSKQTTPVTSYAGRGDSPYGVVDLAGNVWEWCMTSYEDGSADSIGQYRVLRGGAWFRTSPNDFYTTARAHAAPIYGNYGRGFRIARLDP